MKEIASYITIDPGIRFGKPSIAGIGIPVSDILQWLASGMSHEEIQKDSPLLKEAHIIAALTFATSRESIIKIVGA